jgi:hypothetical protein
MELHTKNGIQLANIVNFNDYCKATFRRSNKIADVRTFDTASAGVGVFGGLFCNNVVSNDSNPGARPNKTASKTPYSEPAYMIGGGGNNTATPVCAVQFPLSMIHDSLLGLDRDIFFGETIYLKITWAKTNDVYWKGTATDDPADTGATTCNTTITAPTLYLAQEQNILIQQSLMEKFRNGELSFKIPYVYTSTITRNAAEQTLETRWSRTHGEKLRKIIWLPYVFANTRSARYNCDNLAAAKITRFSPSLNHVKLSQFDYFPATFNDYMEAKDKLVGSSILSSNEFQYNNTWYQDFTAGLSTDRDSNVDDGLPLDTETLYTIDLTAATQNLRHYLFAITQKQLTITPDGVTLL